MKKHITPAGLVAAGIETAWEDVALSFDRFCLTAGVATPAMSPGLLGETWFDPIEIAIRGDPHAGDQRGDGESGDRRVAHAGGALP
jgi:hypothetical protein